MKPIRVETKECCKAAIKAIRESKERSRRWWSKQRKALLG